MIVTPRPRTAADKVKVVDISEIPDHADIDDLVTEALIATRETRGSIFDWSYASASHDRAVITLHLD